MDCTAIMILAFENMEIVGMDFIWFSIRLPLTFLVIAIYIVGMVTDSYLWVFTGARRQT
jgi:hypothetical protein